MALSKITPESINLASDFAGMGFGGTGAANQLDDYEEGTWTPVATAGFSAVTHNIQDGRYTKIGDFVIAKFKMTFVSLTGDSNFFAVSGLPFTAGTVNEGCTAPLIDRLTSTVNNITIQVSAGSNSFIFIASNNTNGAHTGLRGNQLTSGTDIRGTVVYFTA